MTRFATFWMDDGEIVAPVNVLRFDDTAYLLHLLGDRLEGLTDTAEVLLDTSTYAAAAARRIPPTAPACPAHSCRRHAHQLRPLSTVCSSVSSSSRSARSTML
jgi:hypothetical protein